MIVGINDTRAIILSIIGILGISSVVYFQLKDKRRTKRRRRKDDADVNEMVQPFPGIANIGNTCYMNSSLQLLASSPVFRQQLSLGSCMLVDKLKFVLDRLNDKSIGVVDGREFISSVFGGRRLDGQEQDAQEFTQILLSRLSEVLPRVNVKGLELSDDGDPFGFYRRLHPFEGVQKQTIRCLACNAALSMRIDAFNLLSLPIAATMDDAIKYSSSLEHLEGYRCDRCMQMNKCVKKSSVIRWPSVLIVYFNRITMDNSGHLHKDNSSIDLADPLHAGYKLSAVIEHWGGLTSGHYIAHRRLSSHYWQSISDASSTINSSLQATQPYLVLYEKFIKH